MRQFIPIVIGISLAACSSVPAPVTSPYFQIPAGSKLVLKQTLTIPPHAARVYIQYGKVVTSKQKDNYYAHCWFMSWYVHDTPQTIKPGTFTITRSQKYEDVVLRHQDHMYAMNGLGMAMYQDGGPMALVYSTVMDIHSDRQPDIRRFGCGYWEDPKDAHHLTVAQMQKALGNIARIEINTEERGQSAGK